MQVSKKFNIPSRTLYDKVKKMGITTGRQQQRKSMNNSNFNYSAAFPGLPLSGLSPMSHMAGAGAGQGAEQALADNPYKSCLLYFSKIGMPSFLRSVLWNVDL